MFFEFLFLTCWKSKKKLQLNFSTNFFVAVDNECCWFLLTGLRDKKHNSYNMATWWCCCLNYSRIYELVDAQGRISGEQEKQFNDQLSKMNNFPGMTVWMWESADRDWRGFFVKRLQTGFLRSRCKTVQSRYDAAFFAPVPPNFMHVNMRTRICKTFIRILNGPSSPQKATDSHLRHESKVDLRNGRGDLEECFAFKRRLK